MNRRRSRQPLGGAAYARLLATARVVQDRVAGAGPDEPALEAVAVALEEVATALAPLQVPEGEQASGTRPELFGRGLSLLPPYVTDERGRDHLRGRVVFTRFYLGGNGAAHGGAVALLWDELLGDLANSEDRPAARTAYLHVNYRHIAPVDVELRFEVDGGRVEGRKRWVTGRLHDGDTLVSDAEGLFVELLPGQP